MTKATQYSDRHAHAVNGLFALFLVLVLTFGSLTAGLLGLEYGFGGVLLGLFLLKSFVIISPNHLLVLEFFGKYHGTVDATGLKAVNPFMSKKLVSTRVANFANPPIKVNDARGNPLELSAMFGWRVRDAARAIYGVANYEAYLTNQVEGIMAQVASQYPYDSEVEGELCFRKNISEIAKKLHHLLQDRVADYGIEIVDVRINHFAYAVEIAAAMLKKQQAEALLDARKKIVDGAHKMVVDLLKRMSEEQNIRFTEEDKVRLATNLMTVLVSDTGAQPVLKL